MSDQVSARHRVVTMLAGAGLLAAGLVALSPAPAYAKAPCFPSDVVIGSPKADVGGVVDAGSVQIRSVCDPSAAAQTLTLPTPKAGEFFGFAVAKVNLSFDGTPGLLIGIPQYNVGSAVDAGAVASYRTVAGRYVLDRIITQDTPGIPGTVQAGAKFGTTIAAFVTPDEYSYQYVRIGVPNLDVGTVKDAGGVVDLTYYGPSYDGAPPAPPLGTPVNSRTRLITLNSAGVPWIAHAGDRFGRALGGYGDLADVGAPGRTVTGHVDAGAVLKGLDPGTAAQTQGSPPAWVTQLTAGIAGSPEAGDRFGAALAGEWIGTPGEDLDGVVDAGMVHRYASTQIGLESYTLTEKSSAFQGSQHAGDLFGASLLEQHYYEDDLHYAPQRLLIGAPGADTAAGKNSGTVSWQNETYEQEEQTTTLGTRGVTTGATPAAGAAYGTALGIDGTFLLASAPGGRGAVDAFMISGTTFTPHHRYVGPSTEAGVYGTALSVG